MTFPADIGLAALTCFDAKRREELQLAHADLVWALNHLQLDATKDTLTRVNALWAHATRLMDQVNGKTPDAA